VHCRNPLQNTPETKRSWRFASCLIKHISSKCHPRVSTLRSNITSMKGRGLREGTRSIHMHHRSLETKHRPLISSAYHQNTTHVLHTMSA
jgi:hypothetical protein